MSYSNEEEFRKFLCDVLDSLKGNLLPEMKQYKSSIKILLHIAQGSQISSDFIVTEISPILVNTVSIASVQYKPIILEALVIFVQTYLTQNKTTDTKKILEPVISLCFQSMADYNDDLRKQVFDSFSVLAQYLPEDVRKILYKAVIKYLVTPETSSVRIAFNNCLLELSKHYGNEVKEFISDVTINDNESLDIYLTSLCNLATLEDFRIILANILVKYINQNADSACIVTKNLNRLLQIEQDNTEHLLVYFEKNFIGILIDFCINHISDVKVQETLLDVAAVIKILIGCQESFSQKIILDHWLNKLATDIETNESFVILLDGLLSRLNRDVQIDYGLIEKLCMLTVNSGNDRNKEVAVQLLANVLSKKDIGKW